MKITCMSDDLTNFRVDSDSGAVYEITYAGCGDEPDMVELWNCSCPSRGTCKHLTAFFNSQLPDPDFTSKGDFDEWPNAPGA